MSCVALIIDLIEGLGCGVLFSTRECLNFGLRNAVDKALSRLVKIGYIVRVARGVFVRPDSEPVTYTVSDIAAVKAAVYNKSFATHGADLAHQFGLADVANAEATFYVGGSSSSFDTIFERVHFKRASAKKIASGEGTVGTFIRALWYLRLPALTEVVHKAVACLSESEQANLANSAHLMPGWLSAQLRSHFSASYTVTENAT